jgi:zinc protease
MRQKTVLHIFAFSLMLTTSLQATTPLPQDPNNVYGKFDNGFSYIIRKHKNPPGRMAFFLHVKTGAYNESDTQNGLAHFLEHMAFNGSKHYPPGTLVPFLNKLGMQFGADTNAHTNTHETVYKLMLPNTSEKTMIDALTIFQDYASSLMLSDEEINNERKVILEESRAHKSAGERLQKEWMRRAFTGTRAASHDVIGDEKQIAEFPKAEFDDYWNTWYRPDNMTLIVVGEVDPDKVIAAAKPLFSDLKPRAKDRKPGNTGIEPGKNPAPQPRAIVLSDPEQVMGTVQLLAVKPGRAPMKTFEEYRFNELENLGTWIVSRRMRDMVNAGTAAFRGGGVTVSSMEHDAITPMAIALGEPADWNKMLEQLIVEVNRAIEHGFTKHELELARNEAVSDAQRGVQVEPTISAGAMINRLSGFVGEGDPILSAAQRLELIEKIMKDVSLDDVHSVLVDNFKTRDYIYSLRMPKKDEIKLPTEEEVLAAANESWSRKTTPQKDESEDLKLLAKLPAPGEVAEQTTDPDLKITTAKLTNGVVVHHRNMDYKKNTVLVSIIMPGGTIEETADNRGVSDVASLVFSSPATSRLTSTQIEDLMTGKKVSVGGDISADTLNVFINGDPSELETGFQLAYALLTDGKIELSAFDNWKKSILQQLERLKKDAGGQLGEAVQDTIFGGDVRHKMLTKEQVEKVTVKQAQERLRRLTGTAAMEVTIVGDIELKPAFELVKKYLGALPQRSKGFDSLDPLRKIERSKGPYVVHKEIDSITPKAMTMAGFVGCDERAVLDRRLLSMASRIISDRMIKKIREEDQLVYSIGCQSRPGRIVPDTGMFVAAAPTDAKNGEKLADEILAMIKEFADKGPTDEEVTTAKKQMATFMETNMKEPSFWLGQISENTYRNRPLSELKDLPQVYQTFTGKQLQEVVTKYMTPDRILRLVIIPNANKTSDNDESANPHKKRNHKEKISG